jgi:hypothetical protein
MKLATGNASVLFARRRNAILRELRQMKDDIDHWNETHPDEQPIVIDFDLSKDVERLVSGKER